MKRQFPDAAAECLAPISARAAAFSFLEPRSGFFEGRGHSRPRFSAAGAPGFTLVEILAAMVVLGLGCLAAISMQTTAIRSGSQAAHLTMASFLAESQVEWLRSMDFNAVTFVSQAPERLTRNGEVCAPGAPARTCYYTRTTTIITGSPTTRSHEVSVKVEWSWPDSGAGRHIIYDTVISDYGF